MEPITHPGQPNVPLRQTPQVLDEVLLVCLAKAQRVLRYRLCDFWLGYQDPERGGDRGAILLKYKRNGSFYPSRAITVRGEDIWGCQSSHRSLRTTPSTMAPLVTHT